MESLPEKENTPVLTAMKADVKEDEYKPEKPLHESETLSFWQSESMNAKQKRMDFMANQIKALVALKMQKQDNLPSEVSPGVFLGSIGAALSKATLLDHGITHVLTAAGKIKPAHPKDFTYKCMNLLDSPSENIKDSFEESTQFIAEALKKKGKVLVHCFAGKSRSTTLVVAFMMREFKMTMPQCLKQIRTKRAIAQPNAGFMRQLRMYEAQLIKAGHIKLPDDSDDESA